MAPLSFLMRPVLGLVLVAGIAGPAAAVSEPNKTFAGKIMLSDKRFPLRAASASAFTAQVRKQSKSNFYVNKENGTYKLYYAAFFKQPLNTVELKVKLYDLTDGQRREVASFEQYADSPDTYTYISNLTLDKKSVGVNRQLLMTVDKGDQTIASTKFKILGDGDRFNGKVDFSEEESNPQ